MNILFIVVISVNVNGKKLLLRSLINFKDSCNLINKYFKILFSEKCKSEHRQCKTLSNKSGLNLLRRPRFYCCIVF